MKTCCFCGVTDKEAKVESYHGKYFCKKHYLQYMRHGKCFDRTIYDPNDYEIDGEVAKIFMYDKQGNRVGTALVDKEDLGKCLEYKWHIKKSRKTDYAISTLNERKKVFLHRFILGYNGDLDVDHINGNGLDNRKANLRICSHSKNIMNQRKRTAGIYKVKSGRYRASICYHYKTIYIGTYDTEEEAIEARKKKELELVG